MALIDDLRLYYSLSDNTDAHGVGPNFTEVNTPTYIAAKVGNGVDTDITNQSYLSVANASAGDFQVGLTDFSFSVWAYFNALPASNTNILRFGAINAATQGWHCIVNSTGQVILRLSNGTTLFSISAATGTIATGALYHIVGRASRTGAMVLYVNGAQMGTSTISAASASNIQSTEPFLIGGLFNQFSDAIIDEFSMWNKNISMATVDWLYNDGDGRSYADVLAATTLGGRIRENFGGLALGTGTPAGFTALGSSGTTFEVVTDGTSEGGRALQIQKTGAGRARLTLNELDGKTQQDVVMLFELSTTGLTPGIIINSINGAGAETEYLFEASGTQVRLWEGVAGTYTQRAVNTALGAALTSGVLYAMRIRRQGDTYYGRIWLPASADEPTSWNVTTTDGSPRGAGGAGISFTAASGTMTVHYISTAYGNDCGCELPDSDFPATGLYVTSSTDGSLRVYDEADAGTNAVVSIFGPAASVDIRACAVHQANETVFVAQRLLGVVTRVDRYGLNPTTINDTVVAPFGLDIDEAAGRLFISDNAAGQFYTDDIGGGNQANPLALATASHVHWDAVNSKLWWVGNGNVYSGNNAFGASTDYLAPPATPIHAISDGTTVAVADPDTAGADGVFTKPVAAPSDPWTSVDTTVVMEGLAINGARNAAYGVSVNGGTVVYWSAYPPAVANRSTFASLNGARFVDWFEFSTGVEFSVNNASVDVSAETTTISQDHQVTPNAGAVAVASEGATIAQNHVIAPNAGAVSVEAQAVTITQNHVITVGNASVGVTVTTTTFSTGTTFSPDDAAVALSVQGVTITQVHVLVPANGAVSVAAALASILQNHVIAPAGSSVSVTVQNTALTLPSNLGSMSAALGIGLQATARLGSGISIKSTIGA